jgi:hypothetical protein
MSRKKKQPDPDVIRLTNLSAKVVSSFTITNVSEADIRMLHEGRVPDWIIQTADYYLRDNPKPSDIDPAFFKAREEEQAADAVARDVA